MKEESIMIDILQRLDENLQLLNFYHEDNHLTLVFKLQTNSATFPNCCHISVRPHNNYSAFRDLPIHDAVG
jgi:hypothetical protein